MRRRCYFSHVFRTLNHQIGKKNSYCKGTQTSMSEKSSDQSAVDETAIAGPDTQASQLPSTSTPDSTSLDGNSNPTSLITTHKK